ncbi:MAG TPA: transposase [Rubrivivax sp.]|nr:transposase [Rubrivivax sp.]HPO17697.1 transposase [Rubrivivax sp.]
MPREGWSRQPLCAGIDRFSLHAAVRVQAHDRKRLEQLCCCITRPALSDERIQKIIAAILERPVIEKILAHLGLDPQPRPGAGRARRGKTAAA